MNEHLDQERDLLAAEHALGLLEGEARAEARRLEALDPAFAEAVDAWHIQLAPLADEIADEAPDSQVWRRIVQMIDEPAGDRLQEGSNVVQLRRRASLWRGYGVGMTALAASLALVLGYQAGRDGPPIEQPGQAPAMVAALSSDDAQVTVTVAYDPREGALLVTPARLQPVPGQAHELWIVPADGTPVSLGLVRADAPRRHLVPQAVAPHFRAQAGIALSIEPLGGSSTGAPTGAVVAAGELVII